jgi:hypothetical protein
MNDGLVPPNWTDLVEHSSEMATKQSFALAENWLQGSSTNNELQAPDNPVVDPYAVVTDHHISNERRRRESRNVSLKKQSSSTTMLHHIQLAVSEGEGSTLVRKRSLISAKDNVVT